MKIVLPKSLAEPLIIPWDDFIPINDASEGNVAEALHRLIDNFERREIMPGKGEAPKGVHSMLQITAEEAGADQASATSYPIFECKKHVGDDYVVIFSLPNSKSLYNWSRKSWHGLFSVMYPS